MIGYIADGGASLRVIAAADEGRQEADHDETIFALKEVENVVRDIAGVGTERVAWR